MAIKTVGVVGAGQMGSGIAHVCALAGFDVLLHDAAADRLEKGIATINGNMARQVASGKLMEDQRAAAMKLIRPANSMRIWRASIWPSKRQRKTKPSSARSSRSFVRF